MGELFVKGGILMWPLLACSVAALAVVIERALRVRPKKVMPQEFLSEVEDLVQRRKLPEAMTLCKTNNSSLAQILLKGIENFGKNRAVIKEKIEEVGRRESAQLEKGCGILGTVASIAPLLGLLGTVFGMIKVFHVISVKGNSNVEYLSGGISEALITTAAGLIIAIPVLVAYKYFLSKVETLVTEMEEHSVRILDKLGDH